jgi:hypothetical protein
MPLHFLYPSDPIDLRKPDAIFMEQVDELRKLGLEVSTFSLGQLGDATCKIRKPIPIGATVIYRGWMLKATEYEQLLSLIQTQQAVPLTSSEIYLSCHYLPNWYPLIREFTAETEILPAYADFSVALKTLNWEKFFIKDYVKSLKTSVGSVISRPEEIHLVLAELQKFRGTIEGGVCVRRYEDLIPYSEKRYFVIQGQAHGAVGPVPDLVSECARRIASPFFSIDVATRADGVLRVVEIGDGQVSDLVGWEPARFAELWKSLDTMKN